MQFGSQLQAPLDSSQKKPVRHTASPQRLQVPPAHGSARSADCRACVSNDSSSFDCSLGEAMLLELLGGASVAAALAALLVVWPPAQAPKMAETNKAVGRLRGEVMDIVGLSFNTVQMNHFGRAGGGLRLFPLLTPPQRDGQGIRHRFAEVLVTQACHRDG